MGSEKRLYVLDTNVLMHDPTSIFRFEEHDVLLPMMVLEELDAAKKGLSEVARNVRQVSRFIGEMMQHQPHADLDEGLELREPEGLELKAGTGKTLLALAAGLSQTMDEKRYTEIIVTRATVSIGEDIGYLPGT